MPYDYGYESNRYMYLLDSKQFLPNFKIGSNSDVILATNSKHIHQYVNIYTFRKMTFVFHVYSIDIRSFLQRKLTEQMKLQPRNNDVKRIQLNREGNNTE